MDSRERGRRWPTPGRRDHVAEQDLERALILGTCQVLRDDLLVGRADALTQRSAQGRQELLARLSRERFV